MFQDDSNDIIYVKGEFIMRRWFVLILGLVILLSACGQKYDKEIDAVLNSERKSMSESSFKA